FLSRIQVELAGDADINLHNWSLHFYNGDTGTVYKKHTFSTETFKNGHNNFGFIAVKISGIQNGSPDGIVLADASNTIIQFLSYEGSFTAIDGIADGFTSTDISFQEYSSTQVGFSLQLTGKGEQYNDFTWSAPQENTFERVNLLQTFTDNKSVAIPVNEPRHLFLIILLLIIVRLFKTE
ncbi:MAG: hypothetical protein OCD00_07110, partial [Colwellia sp.]